MSDNKIFEEDFVFEEEIDFDGLDVDSDDIDSEDTSDAEDDSVEEVAVLEDDILPERESIAAPEKENSVNDIETNTYEQLEEQIPSDGTDVGYSEIDIYLNKNESNFSLDANKTENFKNNNETTISRFCIINTAVSIVTLCAVVAGFAFGYSYLHSFEDDLALKKAEIAELEEKNSILEEDYLEAVNLFEEKGKELTDLNGETTTENGKILFYDTSVGYSWTPVLSGIKRNDYKNENFVIDNRNRISYIDSEEVSSYFGIDVSSYQGDIDWQLVKEDNVEFAFLRIGYRGYGEEGKLCPDENFVANYDDAHDVGLDLGVYFFSQATNVDEAVEEANYVLSLLEGRTLEYPIVFDWETVYTGDPEDIPRTEDVKPQTLTLSAIAFCETIREAGYDAMIYTNKKLATIKYDLRQLQDYPIWLAYYDTELNYCYDFDVWQYGTGQVDGIDGEVDINIAMIK